MTVEEDSGTGSFVAAAGETVNASLVAGSVGSISGGTCTTTTTNASGQCTVIVNSAVTGTADVHATSNVAVGGISVPNPGYDARHWWRYSEGVQDVLREALAYVYARFLFHP